MQVPILNDISSQFHGVLMLTSQHQCPAMIGRLFTPLFLVCVLASALLRWRLLS